MPSERLGDAKNCGAQIGADHLEIRRVDDKCVGCSSQRVAGFAAQRQVDCDVKLIWTGGRDDESEKRVLTVVEI